MRVLLTGATGFVGQRLCRRLIDNGVQTGIIVRREQPDLNVASFVYDGSYRSVLAAVEEFEPDSIIHLATAYSSGSNWSPDNLIHANVMLPFFLLEAGVSRGSRFIAAGSYWQFGNAGEDTALDSYAASKEALEAFSNYYAYRHDAWIAHLYLYGTYGSGDNRGKVIDQVLQAIVSGSRLDLSPGEQKLDLVHVEDVVDAFLVVLDDARLLPGAVHRYGVFSGQPFSLRQLVHLCETWLGVSASVALGGKRYREAELMEPRYPYPRVPGWQPTRTLEQYCRHYRQSTAQHD